MAIAIQMLSVPQTWYFIMAAKYVKGDETIFARHTLPLSNHFTRGTIVSEANDVQPAHTDSMKGKLLLTVRFVHTFLLDQTNRSHTRQFFLMRYFCSDFGSFQEVSLIGLATFQSFSFRYI